MLGPRKPQLIFELLRLERYRMESLSLHNICAEYAFVKTVPGATGRCESGCMSDETAIDI